MHWGISIALMSESGQQRRLPVRSRQVCFTSVNRHWCYVLVGPVRARALNRFAIVALCGSS
jgi:hypothetical protein